MFPVINTIDDVLPFIKDNENFTVNHKDDYIVIDYILNTPDMFQNPIQKECRGLIFYKDGRIMSRRLHKFFNFGERPESSLENIDLSKKHWILNKEDGSMITPLIVNGELTWGSKAGVTFLTPQVEEFIKSHYNYEIFVKQIMNFDMTPIFEWCSRKNRIVIDYPEDHLFLLAIRDNINGEYVDYDRLKDFERSYLIEVVKQWQVDPLYVNGFVEYIKGMTGIEGFVLRFEDGQMIKIKCDEYLRYHRAKDDINFEKNVVAILVNNQADDFRTLLNDIDRKRFEAFEKDFFENVQREASMTYGCYDYYKTLTRKEFALQSQNWVCQSVRSIIFHFFDVDATYEDIYKETLNRIRKSCTSQSKVDEIRGLFGYIHWRDY